MSLVYLTFPLSYSQGFYSRWGQLAHLTKLQSFISKRNRKKRWHRQTISSSENCWELRYMTKHTRSTMPRLSSSAWTFCSLHYIHGLLENTAVAAILENNSVLGLENYATRMRWANIWATSLKYGCWTAALAVILFCGSYRSIWDNRSSPSGSKLGIISCTSKFHPWN